MSTWSSEEDLEAEIAGTYEVTVPGNVPPAVGVSIALDAFHRIGIDCLDDFSITCFINGEEVAQSDDEGYSHEGEALSDVHKIN